MSWLPQLVGVMWEVLQQLRCDRQPLSPARRGVELHTAKVPTPTLARQHCRWCQILDQKEEEEQEKEEEEDSVYETVELARVEVRTDSDSLERTYSVVRPRDRGRDRERYRGRERERTYGEVREREGRTRERQVESDWRGRSPERSWRGRSSSSLRWEEPGVSWQPGEAGESAGWRGRVSSGEFVGRGAEWRGRSPGITGEYW